MRKVNKKKIGILIIIVIMVVIEIVAFELSKGQNIKDIELTIIDNDSILNNETMMIQAVEDDKSGYYIILPETINGKLVNNYIVQEKTIHEEIPEEIVEDVIENTTLENTVTLAENTVDPAIENITENTVQNTIIEESKTIEPVIIEEIITVEKVQGDKVYLTQEEIDSQTMTIKAEYDKRDIGVNTFYNKIIDETIDDTLIAVQGYMPLESNVALDYANMEEVEEIVKEYLDDDTFLDSAYDIKIVSNEQNFNPSSVGETVRVTMAGAGDFRQDRIYKVLHIKETKEIEEIDKVEVEDGQISFEAKDFSVYVVLYENGTNMRLRSAVLLNSVALASTANNWDGSTASDFEYGNGTYSSPYLITSGAELAYLRDEVNNGSTFENTYFELITDINLNDNNWTPIGTNNNSFRGIFDGGGHIICNATITTSTSTPTSRYAYGFFGSIGGGNSYAIIKNVQFDNISVNITTNANLSSSSGGLHIGIVTGKMYRCSEIINVIVNNSTISNTNAVSLRSNGFQLFVGGIAGFATNTTNSEADPGNGNRYAIENCFSNVAINLTFTLRSNSRSYAGQFAAGGIIGAVRSQPVWPENCLYIGDINTNGFIGPILGYLRNNTSYTSTSNYQTLWYGENAGSLTMTSYYSNYATNGTEFTSTYTSGNTPNNTTYRITTSTSNIMNVEGMNKGIYTSDISSMLSRFNSYSSNNDYVTWIYSDGTYSFLPRFSTDVDDSNKPTYVVNVTNNYGVSSAYTYTWKVNGAINTSLTGNTVTQVASLNIDYNYEILITDGTYYTVASFVIPKLELHIEFSINDETNTVTASLAGTALPYINTGDYAYQWYKSNLSGLESGAIDGATSVTLNNLEEGVDYTIIATNVVDNMFSREGMFTYGGERTVVYVDYNYGSDNNDGFTPDTPVETIAGAYDRLNPTGKVFLNVIVIMGNYTNGSYFNAESSNVYNKKAIFTSLYKGTDYNGTLYLEGANTYKYLTEDTAFEHIELRGSTSSYGTGSLYFYLQGHNLTMGEGITMTRYATANTNQGLIQGNAPAFHIIGGWLRYDYATLPRNNSVILIKSGIYGRIIAGGSSGTNSVNNMYQYTSYNFTGSSMSDAYNTTIIVDIKNSTRPSNYTYDINLLVGGSAWGNMYANITENIISGSVGRVLGASIGDSSVIPSGWQHPLNTFLGSTTINISGGRVTELYGGCLGRNMSALSGSSSVTCDSYFYGVIDINITGGTVEGNIYGAGAGGVTGYHLNSSDPYKSYGSSVSTSVNIDILGGTVGGNIYGGGYGYTEYLTESVTASDGGALYGNTNITIRRNSNS